MKIIRLQSENVKRLKAVSIQADGKPMVTIGGRNGAGKTSVLDSIEMALGGTKTIPQRPIRDGQSKARVIVETDELVVTRTFNASGSQVVVTGKDGAKIGSPQTLLDRLVGDLSFDPLAFSRMRPAEQAQTLRDVVGLDLSALDQERVKVFDQRTDVNRQVKALDAQIDAIPVAAAPAAEVSVADLSVELERRMKANDGNVLKRRTLASNVSTLTETEVRIKEIERQLALANKGASALREMIAKQRAEVDGLKDADIDEVREEMARAEDTNRLVRANAARANLVEQNLKLSKQADALTKRIEKIDEEKAEMLAEAKFPVPGLAFDADGVTLNGLPFEQACDSEKLKVSVAMGFALHKELKVTLVRDGSLLDSDSLKQLAEMAEAAGAQVWLERVGDDATCSIIIEDGMVAAEKE